jgi:AraC-like DNA-binding protein
MADVCPELVFHYKGQFDEVDEKGERTPSFLSGITGPTNQTSKFVIDSGFSMFGIYFYPHTIPLLFGIPAKELTNQMVEIDLILKGIGANLEDQIMNSSSDEQRITIIESFVEKRLIKSRTTQLPVFDAFKHIIHADATPTVKQLSSDHALSERQLERQFSQFAGFSPKQFIRIARFHHAIQFYGKEYLKLSDIALDCGYYDQSHFIHDFNQFAGIGPKEYFSGKSPNTKWRE